MTEEGNDDMPEEAETLSAKQAARELGIDARTFRKFMRATTPKEEQPGQGNRYAIDASDIKALKKAYSEWTKPKQTEVPTPKKSKKSKAKTIEVEEGDDEDLILDEDIDLD